MKKYNIGFTASTFDLLHAGHILMLREAKEQCEYLICGLQVDPTIDRDNKNQPIQTLTERFIQLSACKYVDEIVPYVTEADLEEVLRAYPINVRILGEEYRHTNFTGRDICKSRDIALYFNKRDHKMSSSGLRARVYNAEVDKIEAKRSHVISNSSFGQQSIVSSK
jgi:glycerol-3-phosphate cytidylyltransferase